MGGDGRPRIIRGTARHAAAAVMEHYSKSAERLAVKAVERLGIVD